MKIKHECMWSQREEIVREHYPFPYALGLKSGKP